MSDVSSSVFESRIFIVLMVFTCVTLSSPSSIGSYLGSVFGSVERTGDAKNAY